MNCCPENKLQPKSLNQESNHNEVRHLRKIRLSQIIRDVDVGSVIALPGERFRWTALGKGSSRDGRAGHNKYEEWEKKDESRMTPRISACHKQRDVCVSHMPRFRCVGGNDEFQSGLHDFEISMRQSSRAI